MKNKKLSESLSAYYLMEEAKWLTIFSSQPLECKLKREKEGKEERTGSKGGREGGNGREKVTGRGKQKLE